MFKLIRRNESKLQDFFKEFKVPEEKILINEPNFIAYLKKYLIMIKEKEGEEKLRF